MASYAVATANASSPLKQYYDFQWLLIGNLGVDLLVMPFASAIGVEWASKLIALAIPITLAGGFLMCAYECHGRIPSTALFALPLVYCYPFLFGFVNFCLGMALYSILVALFMRWTRSRQIILRNVVLGLAAPLIWICHAIPWFLLVATCGSLLAFAEFLGSTSWAVRIRRIITGGTPLLTPLLVIPFAAKDGAFNASGWLDWRLSLKWAASAFRDRWVAFDLACTAIVGIVLLLALLRYKGLAIQPRLALIGVVLAAVFLIAPQEINDSAYVSARVFPYSLAFLLLAIDTRSVTDPWSKILTSCAIAFFVIRIAGLSLSMVQYDRSYSAALSQIDNIPQGSRVATFIPQTCKSSFANWGGSRLEHIGGMVVVRKSGFVNSEWTIEGLQLLKVRYTAAGDFQSDPSEFVHLKSCGFYDGRPLLKDALARLPKEAFDYVWVLGVSEIGSVPLRGMKMIARNNDAVLFEIHNADARQTGTSVE